MAAIWRIEDYGGLAEAIDADVWFQQPATAQPLLEKISIFGEAADPTPGEVRVTIVSVTPPIPAGVTLGPVPAARAPMVELTLAVPDARLLLGQNPMILELGVQVLAGGQVVDVQAFEAITPHHTEVIVYRPDPSHRPRYTIVVDVEDWGGNGGGLLGVERRSYVFGLRKDYTPNRDALLAAVNARR
jgi:hypothetical protein